MENEVRQPQIPTEFGFLVKEISDLEGVLDSLRSALMPVLRESDPEDEKGKPESMDSLVPLALDIRTLRNRVRNASLYLSDTITRLEI